MSKISRPSQQPFWRCDRCGTPNPSVDYVTHCLGCGASRDGMISPAEAGGETSAKPVVTPQIRRSRMRLLIATLVYSVIVFVASLMVRILGDAWLPGLLLIMSPRWLFLIPAPILLFFAWRLKRLPVAAVVLLDVLFVLGPLMGFGVPWGKFDEARPQGQVVRVMTFNRGGGKVDIPRLSRYVERQKIDVICFQDFIPDPVLDAYFDGAGWHHDKNRSIVSKHPITFEYPRPEEHNLDANRYTLTAFRAKIKPANGQEFVVASIQLPTLRFGLNRLFKGHVGGFRKQADWWASEFERLVELCAEPAPIPTIIGGDFNMPIESTAMYGLIEKDVFQSAFEVAGFGWGYTRPSQFSWVRIDHIFSSTDCIVRECWIGPDFGSDHKSMIAEIALPAPTAAEPPAQAAQP